MGDFHDLVVWQKAHRLTLDVYRKTSLFPSHEMYGLTSQVRRACLSIPANIAEGSGRGGDREFHRFLRIAQGSAAELEYHLLLARDLDYFNEGDYEELVSATNEVKRMLHRLLERITEYGPRLVTRDS